MAKKPKASRTSYSKGEGLKKMANAEVQDIPFTTLQTHITPNHSKRVKLGSGMGRKPILDDQREAIIVDVPIRKDRANEGASVGEAVDIPEQTCAEYSRKHLDQAFRRTVRPQYSERMTDPVAVQATTTKRTAITPAQQWR
jgi:hypothetical protein